MHKLGVWKTTGEAENPRIFLQYDSGPDSGERLLILTTDPLLYVMSIADTIAADGNFKICPRLFMQIYLVRAKFTTSSGYIWVTVAYALLERKTSSIYYTLFAKLRDLCEEKGFRSPLPETLLVDFEAAVFKSAALVFPAMKIQGCFYHLTQSTFR